MEVFGLNGASDGPKTARTQGAPLRRVRIGNSKEGADRLLEGLGRPSNAILFDSPRGPEFLAIAAASLLEASREVSRRNSTLRIGISVVGSIAWCPLQAFAAGSSALHWFELTCQRMHAFVCCRNSLRLALWDPNGSDSIVPLQEEVSLCLI